jgi:hypothetical protein
MRHNDRPAFPRPASEMTKHGTLADGNEAIPEQDGMTLRDYFAARAMQALIPLHDTHDRELAEAITATASTAYQIADAMLVARYP